VSIGASSTIAANLFGPFVEACRAMLPKVTLRCFSAGGAILKARLEAHTLHLALAYEDEFTPNFARLPVFRQACFLISDTPPPGNPASIALRDLATLPLVLPAQPNVLRTLLDRVFAQAGLASLVVSEADVMSSTLSAVQAGIGAAILPIGDFSGVPGQGDLYTTPIDPPIMITASVLWPAGGALTPATTAVRDLLVRFIEEQYLNPLPAGAEMFETTDQGPEQSRSPRRH
jgi:LysR family transcriptional regulator, nitrogen assimilation regulatory protein